MFWIIKRGCYIFKVVVYASWLCTSRLYVRYYLLFYHLLVCKYFLPLEGSLINSNKKVLLFLRGLLDIKTTDQNKSSVKLNKIVAKILITKNVKFYRINYKIMTELYLLEHFDDRNFKFKISWLDIIFIVKKDDWKNTDFFRRKWLFQT